MQQPEIRIPPLPQEALDSIKNKVLDLHYCDQSSYQVLDIYYPENCKGPYPVIAHFHGGAFKFGTQRDVNLRPILRALSRGYAVVSVQYRMSGEAHFPALIWDAKASIRFIRANAEKYCLDGDRIAAWGPSSGGYIVSMLGVTGDNPAFEDLSMGNSHVNSSVQAVVDWCGPCGGFLNMDTSILKSGIGCADHNDEGSPESLIMGAQITKIPELVSLACPCRYAHKEAPPFLIHHGEADPIVPVAQSAALAQALKNAGASVTLETFTGRGHHGEPWYEETWLSDKVLDFLDSILKK